MTTIAKIVQTMSSDEIAKLTAKQHKNVIRDIRAMLEELKEDGSDLSHVREDKDGRGYTSMFHLDRELTDTLLTGYSASARRAVIRRWHQLESEAAQPRIPFSVGKTDTLSAMEADQLRDMLTAGVKALPHNAQAKAMTQGWAKLKAHFKVTYRQIPRAELPEAMSIVARHLAGFDPQPVALPAPPQPEQLLRALDSMHLMASSVADLSSAVFHLVERQKGEGLNGGNRQPLGETYAAATAKASVITPL